MATSLPATHGATRAALHTVAEHVLAPALHRATGRIGLRPTPGGFGTPWFPAGDRQRQVRVEGTDLVVAERGAQPATQRRAPLRTVGDAASLAEVEPGAPADVYPPVMPLEPDVPLDLDPAAARVIHGWFHLTGQALEAFSREHAAEEPTIAQLWPEHFDLAISMAEVNYGGSPGDDDHDAPYLYVGPWNLDGGGDSFWNEPFGASRPYDEVGAVGDAVAFFEAGRAVAPSAR